MASSQQQQQQFAEEISALMDYFATRKLSFSTACAVMGTVITATMLHSDPKADRETARSFRHMARDLEKSCEPSGKRPRNGWG
jgi:hypothetical protein